MKNSSVSAILLAAGFSSRMGKIKALLPWQGVLLIQYQIEQMQVAGINKIIVVLGYQAEKIKKAITDYDVITVFNEHYEQGKSSSIRKGAVLVNQDTEGILVSAVDQPVPSQTLKKLSKHLKTARPAAVIPVYKDKRGHPILFKGSLKQDLLNVNEQTKGLRHVIQKHHNNIAYLVVDDPFILLNFNKPEDYIKEGGT